MGEIDDMYTPYERTQLLLAQTGLSSISHTLLASTTGLALQCLVTGNVLQLVHRYFNRQSRLFRTAQDPSLARAGVVWLTALIVAHLICVYVICTRVVLMSATFTAGYLMDFWLAQISNLIFTIVLIPIFIFFAFRAWNLWSRRKSVMVLCLASVAPAVGLGITAAALGLQHPYPLESIDNNAFQAWLPFVTMTISRLQWFALASSIAQFVAACVFSALICTGLFTHRQCCSLMPGIAGKIAFITGESLFPLVLTSGGILVGDLLTKTSPQVAIGPLISRAVHSCAPAIYFHCLMTSLTSAQRQRDSLRQSLSHIDNTDDSAEYAGEAGLINHAATSDEKIDPYASNSLDNSQTFDPRFDADGDLDTPLQVCYNDSTSGLGMLPTHSTHGTGNTNGNFRCLVNSGKKRNNTSGTASYPTAPGAPSTSNLAPTDNFTGGGVAGYISGWGASYANATRPSFSLKSPFSKRSSFSRSSAGSTYSAPGNSNNNNTTGGQGHKSNNSYDLTEMESRSDDTYTNLRTAGIGRRSSLARALSTDSTTSNKSSGGLTYKIQNNILPIVSYSYNKNKAMPPLGRRESESIFVAHEEFEFEGLPHTPGDLGLGLSGGLNGERRGLGDIEEVGSERGTPKKADSPERFPSPAPGPSVLGSAGAGEEGWGKEYKSPGSVYEDSMSQVA